jgi:hypothetical protein
MIQLILLLFGLAFPNNLVNTTLINNNQNSISGNLQPESQDTGGDTGPILPPKK